MSRCAIRRVPLFMACRRYLNWRRCARAGGPTGPLVQAPAKCDVGGRALPRGEGPLCVPAGKCRCPASPWPFGQEGGTKKRTAVAVLVMGS